SNFSEKHGDVPWSRLIASPTLWLLWAQYFALSYGWYFYVTWLPTYLQEYRRQSPESSAALAIFPLLFGGFGCLVSGFVSSRFPKVRRKLAIGGFIGAAIFLCLVTQLESPLIAMLAMGM